MELNVVFKDMDPVPELVERLEGKLQRFEERIGKPITAHAVLLQQRNRFDCQIRFPWLKKEFVAAASGWDWISVVDEAADKVGRQLARKEDQLSGRRDGKTLRLSEDLVGVLTPGEVEEIRQEEADEEDLPEFIPETSPEM